MEMKKLDCSLIHIGTCFSAPVYFDDGKNMFLPAGKQAKPFHVSALVKWKIPYLLTEGHPVAPEEFNSSARENKSTAVSGHPENEDVEELEGL